MGAWVLPAIERDSVPAREAEFRFEYFLLKVRRSGTFWVLRDADGFATYQGADGQALLPCWPHPDFAAQSAVGDWASCTPLALSLARFLDTGVSPMARSGLRLLVFPVPGSSGLSLDAAGLAAALANGPAAGVPEARAREDETPPDDRG